MEDLIYKVTADASTMVRNTLVTAYEFADESNLLTIVFSTDGTDLIHLGAATDREADEPSPAEIIARLRAAADQLEAHHAEM